MGVSRAITDFAYCTYLSDLAVDESYQKQGIGWFDNGSLALSYNSQREQRVNQGGQGNPNAAIISDTERTTTWGMNFFLDKLVRGHATLLGADLYRDRVTAPSTALRAVLSVPISR